MLEGLYKNYEEAVKTLENTPIANDSEKQDKVKDLRKILNEVRGKLMKLSIIKKPLWEKDYDNNHENRNGRNNAELNAMTLQRYNDQDQDLDIITEYARMIKNGALVIKQKNDEHLYYLDQGELEVFLSF